MFARVIEEFEGVPGERMSVIDAWAELGRSLHREGLLDDALHAFERYRALVDASGRPSTSSASDIAHIELLLEVGTVDSLNRAATLITLQAAQFTAHGAVLPVERFRHAQVAARVSDRRDDRSAGDLARLALQLSEDRSDPFPNHPGFGAIRSTPQEIDELHRISDRHPSVEEPAPPHRLQQSGGDSETT